MYRVFGNDLASLLAAVAAVRSLAASLIRRRIDGAWPGGVSRTGTGMNASQNGLFAKIGNQGIGLRGSIEAAYDGS